MNPRSVCVCVQSGGLASAHLHVARTVCRRAERSVVALADSVPPEIGKFLNRFGRPRPCARVFAPPTALPRARVCRLSDYLFVSARYASAKAGEEETVYKKA